MYLLSEGEDRTPGGATLVQRPRATLASVHMQAACRYRWAPRRTALRKHAVVRVPRGVNLHINTAEINWK